MFVLAFFVLSMLNLQHPLLDVISVPEKVIQLTPVGTERTLVKLS